VADGFGIASRLRESIGSRAARGDRRNARLYGAGTDRSMNARSIPAAISTRSASLLRDADGTLPFTAADPMEWCIVTSHGNRGAPRRAGRGIPGALSAIAMKLLAKNAEGPLPDGGGGRGCLGAALSHGGRSADRPVPARQRKTRRAVC